MATDAGIAEKQYALIRRLTTVEDERLLDEVERYLDTRGGGVLRRLDDDEMDLVLRELLDEE